MSLPAMQISQKARSLQCAAGSCTARRGHGFAAIQTHYRLDRNLNPTRVTPQTVNLANHVSFVPILVWKAYPAAPPPKHARGRTLHLET
jgi:hypothetical protein